MAFHEHGIPFLSSESKALKNKITQITSFTFTLVEVASRRTRDDEVHMTMFRISGSTTTQWELLMVYPASAPWIFIFHILYIYIIFFFPFE